MNDRRTTAINERQRHGFTLAALVAGILLALQPLLSGHLPWRGDGLLHVYRLVELERALGHGLLFPRWLPDLGYGFGFPLFNYYAPLSYYLLLGPRLLGLSIPAAVQVGYALALIALCLGVFFWGRTLFGPVAGLVAAFAAAYSPYFLFDALHRGTLAELWGLAWLALSLAALHHHVTRRGRASLLLLVLAYAGLVLSHNITALVGSGLLVAYALFLVLLGRRSGERRTQPGLARMSGRPFVTLALGLGLAAFFWLPALLERDLVQIDRFSSAADFFYGNHFLSLGEIAAAPRPADPVQVNPPLAFGLGIPQLLLALLVWLPGSRRPWSRHSAGQQAHLLALTVALIVLLLMVLPISRFLWERLPLLPFVLFPWRFLGPASLLLALLAGAGAGRLQFRPAIQVGGSLILLAAFGLPWLFPGDVPPELALAPDDVIRFEAETGWLGTTSVAEYLPVQVEALPAPETLLPLYEDAAPDYLIPRLDSASLPHGTQILAADYGLTDARLVLEAAAPFEARFRWYDFPGWRLEVNGERRPTFAAGPHGLLAANLPAGRQTVTLAFGDTPVRLWSRAISATSLVALIVAVGVGQGAGQRARAASLAPRAAAGVLLIGLLLFGLKGAVLDRQDNPFVRSAFDGQTIQGVGVPLQVNFGGELLLLGYDLAPEPVPADGAVEVVLYWRAQRPLSTEYSVAMHLVDELGRRYGQADSFHPADYPTTRWLPGEYARDVHRLPLLAGTPPGAYRLLVSVYEPGSGRRLAVSDAAEPAPGAAYPLADVVVAPGAADPDLASLPIEQEASWRPAGAIGLLGYNGPPPTVAVGSPLPVTFFWQAPVTPGSDYQAQMRLVTEQGETVAALTWTPGRESYPTSLWPAGTIVRDERALLVPAALAGKPDVAVESGRYRLLLALTDSHGAPLAGETLDLGRVDIVAPARAFDLPVAPAASPAQFGDVAQLASYELSATRLQPGDDLTLRLYWRATGLTATDYAGFVHLVGPDGEIVAQRDQAPADGSRPTTGWLPGEVVADAYTLPIPADAAAGFYRLRLGLYDPASGQRLPVSGRGVPAGDHLFLPEQLEVGRGG